MIIIGLGNPGKKFENTPHNVGFAVLDQFLKENNFPDFKLSKKSNSLVSESEINGQKIILAKPQTFMNESGKAVKKITANNKTLANNLVVVHDDVDLEIGKIKIVQNRGSAGHKGVESIIKEIGDNNFIRIRIGIGKNNQEAKKIVLKKFSAGEKKLMEESVLKSSQALKSLIENGLEKTTNEYNK